MLDGTLRLTLPLRMQNIDGGWALQPGWRILWLAKPPRRTVDQSYHSRASSSLPRLTWLNESN